MQYDETLYENLSMHNVQLLFLYFNSSNAYEKNKIGITNIIWLETLPKLATKLKTRN